MERRLPLRFESAIYGGFHWANEGQKRQVMVPPQGSTPEWGAYRRTLVLLAAALPCVARAQAVTSAYPQARPISAIPYGIGHFIGMEVHDEGDYEQPLKPGMAMAIEQGIVLPNGLHMQLEDDVIVIETGHEWITRFIPVEPDEVEKMMQTSSSLTTFTSRPWPPAPARAQ